MSIILSKLPLAQNVVLASFGAIEFGELGVISSAEADMFALAELVEFPYYIDGVCVERSENNCEFPLLSLESEHRLKKGGDEVVLAVFENIH